MSDERNGDASDPRTYGGLACAGFAYLKEFRDTSELCVVCGRRPAAHVRGGWQRGLTIGEVELERTALLAVAQGHPEIYAPPEESAATD